MGNLGPSKTVAVLFAIITGVSYKSLRSMGKKVSVGPWTRYVKECGMFLSDTMERNRRNPANKYRLAQPDKVAIDQKNERGNVVVLLIPQHQLLNLYRGRRAGNDGHQ